MKKKVIKSFKIWEQTEYNQSEALSGLTKDEWIQWKNPDGEYEGLEEDFDKIVSILGGEPIYTLDSDSDDRATWEKFVEYVNLSNNGKSGTSHEMMDDGTVLNEFEIDGITYLEMVDRFQGGWSCFIVNEEGKNKINSL